MGFGKFSKGFSFIPRNVPSQPLNAPYNEKN
jgi:hypothetical protein